MSLENIKAQLEDIKNNGESLHSVAATGLLQEIATYEANPLSRLLFKTNVHKAINFYRTKKRMEIILNLCDDLLKYT